MIKSADDPTLTYFLSFTWAEGHTQLLNVFPDLTNLILWLCFAIQLSPNRLHQFELDLNTVAQSPTVLCCTRQLWKSTADQTSSLHLQRPWLGEIAHFSNRFSAAVPLFLCLAAYIGCLSVLFHRFSISFLLDGRDRTKLSASTDLEHGGGQPGPKSRHKLLRNHRFSWFWFVWFLLLVFSVTAVELVRSEGYTLVMESVEVSHDWIPAFLQQCDTKQHDTRPETCLRAQDWRAAPKPVVKRSIKRAYVRAVKHGVAWYKGRCMTPSAFPKALQQPQPDHALPERDKPSPQLTRCNRKHQDAKRFRMLQWNAGGLSTHRLDSIRVWMQENHIDVTVIEETRWTYENEWSDGDFHYIHTGDPKNRGAGLLCVLSTRFCTADSLRWRVIIPGRLIHLQIQLPTRSIDIVGCYQHTQAHTSQREQDRLRWWNQLDALLQGLAARNVLVVTGDFNCSLPQARSHGGPCKYKWRNQWTRGASHADEGKFMSLVRLHGLTALNSWDPCLGPTFIQADKSSRIDFVFTRKLAADGIAKDTKYVWDAPFCTDLHHGHAPILTQLRKTWYAPKDMGTGITTQQRRTGHMAYRAQTDTWQAFLDQTSTALTKVLNDARTSDEHLLPCNCD